MSDYGAIEAVAPPARPSRQRALRAVVCLVGAVAAVDALALSGRRAVAGAAGAAPTRLQYDADDAQAPCGPLSVANTHRNPNNSHFCSGTKLQEFLGYSCQARGGGARRGAAWDGGGGAACETRRGV